MAAYSFNTINDKEFEELARDLLQKHFGFFLESFKTGKDQGIDLRYSSDGSAKSIIVQAKHYEKSGYAALYHKLKDELPKVIILNPSRYVVVTSLALSPQNKSEILNLFNGFIKSTSDIFGKDDLNNLLEIFPEVQRAHIKLYLSSLTVLNEIINNHIKTRSEHKIKEIQKSVHLYVTNAKYEDAIDILNKEHFLIITGEPGIGKTALSNFITYQHLAQGFKFTYILSDLTDAEKVVDNEEKQLFYFDDFLGANYLKVKHYPNQDAVLLSFIQRVKLNKNKRMILTTRSTILNQAKFDFERLNAHELDIARHEIKIKDYESFDKALILYNHLFHSELPFDYLEKIIQKKIYLQIIDHPNYSPRIIQYISEFIRLKNISPDTYPDFILDKLDHPEDIWKDPYESQIEDGDRFLLQTLFTLPTGINETIAREAFNERISYEVKSNGYQKSSNLFNRTLKNLLGGFIHRTVSDNGAFLEYYNPSFGDFMSSYLNKNKEEIDRILRGTIYFDQFLHSFNFENNTTSSLFDGLGKLLNFGWGRNRHIEKVKVSKQTLLQRITEKLDELKMIYPNRSLELAICGFLISQYKLTEVENILLELYPFIQLDVIIPAQFDDLYSIAGLLDEQDTEIYKLLAPEQENILLKLFELVTHERDFTRIKELFIYTNLDYDIFLEKHRTRLQAIIDEFWSEETILDKINDEDFSEIFEQRDMLSKLKEMEAELADINKELKLDQSPNFKTFYNWDYQEVLRENLNKQNEDDDGDYKAPTLNTNHPTQSNENPITRINELFENLLESKSFHHNIT